jgi:hypothetical protein
MVLVLRWDDTAKPLRRAEYWGLVPKVFQKKFWTQELQLALSALHQERIGWKQPVLPTGSRSDHGGFE